MNAYGIFFGKDLKQYSLEQLTNWFGKSGGYFYNIARGIDDRSVNANRIRKSIGVERTFESDVTDRLKLNAIVTDLSKMAFDRCTRSNKFGKSLTLKIKFNDFTQITRSKTELTSISTLQEIEALALFLLENEQKLKPIRLMGVTLSNFPERNETIQLTLEF
jgi:DNA polymerase-4